jgi:hypothetical protein
VFAGVTVAGPTWEARPQMPPQKTTPPPVAEFDADKGGPAAAGLPAATGGETGDPYVPTDDLGPGVPGAPDGRTMLDILVADLAGEEVTAEIGPVALRRRPTYVVVYSKITDGNVIDTAKKRAKDRSRAEGIDGPKFAALICIETCQRIIRDGQVLVDDNERPLRFNHRMLLQAFNAATAVECARRFFGDDADMDAHARKVMAESGWGEDAVEVDVADPQSAG